MLSFPSLHEISPVCQRSTIVFFSFFLLTILFLKNKVGKTDAFSLYLCVTYIEIVHIRTFIFVQTKIFENSI